MMNDRMKEKCKHLRKDCKITIQNFSIGCFATFSNTVETESTGGKIQEGEKKAVIFSK